VASRVAEPHTSQSPRLESHLLEDKAGVDLR